MNSASMHAIIGAFAANGAAARAVVAPPASCVVPPVQSKWGTHVSSPELRARDRQIALRSVDSHLTRRT
ncbi:hypothetical protein IEU95_03850 [Hoyosella rhizosphaerae]|uniref:Uncharacterized protein n=1 Tax=Hoyosella rhizosphaerae TaxID=1755582 RepID=A0A916UC17_9ACTN|nr:hypothetical protein [Hoyosella rhizosphaerae]MBN4925947.1 hypothetical protein [Hoyosella rhizosphaerae]GGC66736.1 hypothetical protein GCM10011410_19190 [Hoyosella rhizosphaerae]